jgi:HAD superfamily hydrolase (TIGR01509 family)
VVQALLFDFDGVVVDTEVPTFQSWRQIYREHGVDLELSHWLPVVGSGSSTGPDAVFDAVAHLEALIGRTLDREALVAARTQLKTELCDRAELLPGVVEYLAEARRLQLKTAIVTRAAATWVKHHLARVGLAHSWDAVVSGDGLDGKRKSLVYDDALERLGVSNREAIAFEDSPHGVQAAKEAGVWCVAVPNRVTRRAAFEAADLLLGSLAERPLTSVLASLTRAWGIAPTA